MVGADGALRGREHGMDWLFAWQALWFQPSLFRMLQVAASISQIAATLAYHPRVA